MIFGFDTPIAPFTEAGRNDEAKLGDLMLSHEVTFLS